jgi:hypothetical protein
MLLTHKILATMKLIIRLLILALIVGSCASLGTKTLYNSFDSNVNLTISKVYVTKPNQINIDFYKESGSDFYFDEIERILKNYNIAIVKSDTTILNFDNISSDSVLKISKASDCDYILLGKVTRLTMMGQTRDFKVEYKIVNSLDSKLKYYSKYSTTFGKTYVILPGSGIPTEEQLMRDAIKLGFSNIEKVVLKK